MMFRLFSSDAVRSRLGGSPLRAAVASLTIVLVAVLTAPVAGAIEGGWNAADTAANRATVRVTTNGSTCSGTLIASNLVLTARHCFRHDKPNPAPHQNRGGGYQDWEYANRFYSLDHIYPNGVNVLVGTNSDNPRHRGTARQYSVPGNVDVAILKLTSPVPSSIATPARVKTSLSNPSGTLAGQTFAVFGFGKSSNGRFSNIMQEGRSNQAAFPCPSNRDGWSLGDAHRICVAGSSGGVRSGDSGGPLHYTDGNGTRWVVGVFQGLESARNGGRYVATFYRGGSGYDGSPRGDIGGWIRWALDNHGGGGTPAPQPAPSPNPAPQPRAQRGCSASGHSNSVVATWPPVSGAVTYVYAISIDGGPDRYDRVNALDKQFSVPSGSRAAIRVSAVFANESYSASVDCSAVSGSAASAPAPTAGCSTASRSGGFQLSWASVPGADWYVYNVGARYFQTWATSAFVPSGGGDVAVRVSSFNSNSHPGGYSPVAKCTGRAA